MRYITYLAILTLLVLFGCKTAEYNSFQQAPPPVEVSVSIKANVLGAEDMERELAAALRARLASLVTVVPDGVEPPPDAVRLDIEINRVRRGGVSPAAVGAATGVAAALLSRDSGGGLINGLFWGLWASQEAKNSQHHEALRLGYVPPRLNGLISLNHHGSPKPFFMDSIPTRAIIDQLPPLGYEERYNLASVNEALARAFAVAIVDKLQNKFDWSGMKTPSWYERSENQSENQDDGYMN
jgi:hypothetical protein